MNSRIKWAKKEISQLTSALVCGSLGAASQRQRKARGRTFLTVWGTEKRRSSKTCFKLIHLFLLVAGWLLRADDVSRTLLGPKRGLGRLACYVVLQQELQLVILFLQRTKALSQYQTLIIAARYCTQALERYSNWISRGLAGGQQI